MSIRMSILVALLVGCFEKEDASDDEDWSTASGATDVPDPFGGSGSGSTEYGDESAGGESTESTADSDSGSTTGDAADGGTGSTDGADTGTDDAENVGTEEGGSDEVDLDGDGFLAAGGDCDDTDAYVNPSATETPYDGIDQDCDGEDLTDVDGDGFDAIVAGGDDCVDTDSASYPGATEYCDSLDNDCDGMFDEEDSVGCNEWFLDEDDDGYGSGVDDSKCLCGPSGDYNADNDADCDDADPEVNPDYEGWAAFPTEAGSWDWNCDGDAEEELEGFGSCSGTLFCSLDSEGWAGALPACGETAMWVAGCSGGTCDVSGDGRVQRCR